jgi:glycosyltransferase involved in cell wall biosynthesis
MKLSIVVPCRNESENIPVLVSRILEVLEKNKIEGEVVIVNDNSTDDTSDKVSLIANSNKNVKLVQRSDGKCGVGRTLKAGFEAASGDIIITMDGDLSHDPNAIPEFLSAIDQGAELVIGSRYIKGGKASMSATRVAISGAYNRLANILFDACLHDVTTGYRAIRKDVLGQLDLNSDNFEIHPEIHLKALNKGFKVKEINITYHNRLHGRSKLNYIKVGIPYLKVLFKESFKRHLRRFKV